MRNRPLGYWVLVLHTHIPYVLAHGRSPHGTDWLCESLAECYLPLYALTVRLAKQGIPARYTVSFTPILQEQLAHPDFHAEATGYMQDFLMRARDDQRYFLAHGDRWKAGLAYLWERAYEAQLDQYQSLGGDLLGAFGHMQQTGAIEIATSAATHGYLPLLGRDECVRAQVQLGVQTYRKHFGCDPRGFWLPECAYRPAYRWLPPVAHALLPAAERAGIEQFLAEAGVRYFFVDTHMLRGGVPLGTYWERFPALRRLYEQFAAHYRPMQTERTPYQAYRVPAPEPLAVFARDPTTTLQVWSGEHGYPGDARYLEFHKMHYPSRLRYWRVSENKADLGAKQPYAPYDAFETVQAHADHFVSLLKQTLGAHHQAHGQPSVMVSMYDTELFGHWWREGPEWLYAVIRRVAADPDIEMLTASEYLERCPPDEVVFLPEGSWGEGGSHYIWLNEQTAWAWEAIYRAEVEFLRLMACARDRADLTPYLQQAARELLLMEASDWTFLITTGSARDYAEVRLLDHAHRFESVAALVRQLLEGEPPDPTLLQVYEESCVRDQAFEGLPLAAWKE
jgi:1,4-alpha-glucan branching enzyme